MISFSSPSAKSYFREILCIDKNITTIYQPCLENVVQLRQFDHDETTFRLLYCGSVTHFLNISLLPKAISLLSESERNRIKIDIVGNGSSLDLLKKEVISNGVENVFSFHGRVTSANTIPFYEQSDVVFVPLSNTSRTAWLIPQKLLETMRLGKPILGMIQGDGRRLICEAGGGVVCNESSNDLAKAISTLINTPKETLKNMGEMNKTFFDSNIRFSLSFIVTQLENEMHSAIKVFKTNHQ